MTRRRLDCCPAQRLLAIGATAFLFHAAPIAAGAQPMSPSATPSDLGGHSAEQPAINNMVSQGIMREAEPGKFEPDAGQSRADFASSMQRMFNLPMPSRPIWFSDLPPNSPIYLAVQSVAPYLHWQMLCPGCALRSDFMPSESVSRAEVTVVLTAILVAQSKIPLLSTVETERVLADVGDASDLPPAARPYFATAIKTGVLALRPGNNMALSLHPSRADTAVLLDGVQKKFNLPRATAMP